jgi:hypothetical protein|tara:strand:- start:12899 stop:13786 length:888 start_codon:yes stop_codon:yes gene_type:complete
MPRSRVIKPSLFDDPDLSDLPFSARWLFIGLFCQADRRGRLLDEPRRIKVRTFPYDDGVDVDALLGLLEAGQFIIRYTAKVDARPQGQRVIQVTNFERHQHPHAKESESEFGPPSKEDTLRKREETLSENVKPGKAGASTGDARMEVAEGSARTPCSSSSSSASASPSASNSKPYVESREAGSSRLRPEPVPLGRTPSTATTPHMAFPCVGALHWGLYPAQVKAWTLAYPDLDVLGECRHALAFIEANPTKRKTVRGMPRFLVAWLNRSTGKGRASIASVNAAVLSAFIAEGGKA